MYISILKSDKENLKQDRKKWIDIDSGTFIDETSDFLWLVVEDDPSVETLVLWVEDDADLTSINHEVIDAGNQYTYITKQLMLKYLDDTDYLGTKYIDEVVVNQAITEADFKIKYTNIIKYRSLIRGILSK